MWNYRIVANLTLDFVGLESCLASIGQLLGLTTLCCCCESWHRHFSLGQFATSAPHSPRPFAGKFHPDRMYPVDPFDILQNVDFISAYGSSCNSLFFTSFSLFFFLYLSLCIPTRLGDASNCKEIEKEGEWGRKRDNYMNCCTQK